MNSILKYSVLPDLADFKENEVKTAIDTVIEEAENNLENALKTKSITWETLLKLEEDSEKITQAFSTISHMNAVCNTKELRESYEYVVTKLTNFYIKVGQNKELFSFYQQIQDQNLSSEQAQTIRKAIVSFEMSGVNLQESSRQRLQEISEELAQLASKFENNVLDATMGWAYTTDNDEYLSGLSKNTIQAAKDKAKQKKLNSKYALGIDIPTYLTVMQQADKRELREIFYKAYSTKASKEADNISFDNDKNIEKILKLRIEKSQILGFKSYAEYSLFTKMAETPDQVLELLNKLLDKSKLQAKKELEELNIFAKENGLADDLKPWDTTYYAEKLKKTRYDFTAEELREYFPLEKVQQGLFKILNSIYGLEIKENTSYKKYITEQLTFDFFKNEKYIGSIICDLFARDNKRGGAWMDGSRTAFIKSNGKVQNPVAYVTCNFLPPSKQGANLTHNDVVTLFHEFGHALHHILSKVSIPSISGTNGVEWDAVELPSQFMENFCWCEEGLNLISGSREGKKLSKEQISKLVGTRHFHSALAMVRQLEFSIFDMNIHFKKLTSVNMVQTELDTVRKKIDLLPVPNYNKFQNSFSHIFAGGYAAGYYSYKWAEILSSDVFSRFEKEGILSNKVGQELLENIISRGSSRDAMDNFVAFMGRKPSEEALLRHSGINS
ncbi:M3 family metallopeptidase [Allofrancisella guangzhouensis]|uniref:oligopeptidase A n=1 Tax=Allofrancisella guangzhouensis TaxID=594679 RepID=A0A0A8E5L6_9GAMM|nr:M3 family metallopeptidase [Allofrancisella guangzhouensis]AJC49505.1 peptidase M3 [Allofrancisella guangzhouensis]MBK2026869.1 M3 family metallopeptidase [Allofrancisella guangzhouensis]MBK2044048.1 M3 family metallopeptidase [Allofrancisella guangzhouensis]MBK2045915.1 M3 family metallopeptidase [Allofrancisella guangzhouensis]